MVLSDILVLNLVALLWRYRGSNLRSKVLTPWGTVFQGQECTRVNHKTERPVIQSSTMKLSVRV